MSSVQSFLKQRAAANTLFTRSTETLYVLVAGSGNYVGNYANDVGYMVTTTAASTGPSPAGGAFYIRDMGKTVQAKIGNGLAVPTSSATVGFFRQVQVLNANAASASLFGVNGQSPGTSPAGNTGDKGYNSYYVAISVGGQVSLDSLGAAVTNASINSILGDAM